MNEEIKCVLKERFFMHRREEIHFYIKGVTVRIKVNKIKETIETINNIKESSKVTLLDFYNNDNYYKNSLEKALEKSDKLIIMSKEVLEDYDKELKEINNNLINYKSKAEEDLYLLNLLDEKYDDLYEININEKLLNKSKERIDRITEKERNELYNKFLTKKTRYDK